jgi:hypothetical protein
MISRRSSWLGLAIAGALAAATPAHAETPPWSVGVTDAQKAEAQTFLDAGNALFLDKKYAEALEKYKAAVGAWDHPAIRFNIVRCLIQLDKPVDAFDNLKLALKFGAAPLEEAVYAEALSYDKLLSNQIADLAVACSQPGVKITLDGQPLGTCPAKETRRVSPGQHQIVGTKQGFLTRTIEVVAIGGKQQSAMISLDPLEKAALIEHRWAQSVPWGVFIGGFAVAGFGGLVNVSAAQDMDRYDASVARNCPTVACKVSPSGPDDPGPFVPSADAELKGRAELKTAIGVSLMVVGGATIATGAVMLYMNRGRTVYPETIERMTPSISPMQGGATFTLSGAF